MWNKGWDYILFGEHADLYLPLLMEIRKYAEADVNGLCQIFEKYKVKHKARILDLFCGIGRHSIELAKKQYEVVGYDPSKSFLKEARKLARTELDCIDNLKFYEGTPISTSKTLRENNENDFDVIIVMDTCLGYNGEEQDLQVLNDLVSLGSEHCILIIQTENRDWRIRNFEPYVSYYFEKTQIHETWRFELESSTSFSDSRFYKKTDENNMSLQLRIDTKLRLYSLHELKDMINRSGWKYLTNFGTFKKLEPANFDSENIITVSKKL